MSTRAGLDNGQSHLYLHVGTALGRGAHLGGLGRLARAQQFQHQGITRTFLGGLVNYLTNLLAQMWVEVGWADLGLDRGLATLTFKNQFDKDKFT